MMPNEPKSFDTLNVYGVDYQCIISEISKGKASNDDWREKVNHYKRIWNMNLGIQKQNNTGFTIPKPQST